MPEQTVPLAEKYASIIAELHGLPKCRELSLAITNIEQSLMWLERVPPNHPPSD